MGMEKQDEKVDVWFGANRSDGQFMCGRME